MAAQEVVAPTYAVARLASEGPSGSRVYAPSAIELGPILPGAKRKTFTGVLTADHTPVIVKFGASPAAVALEALTVQHVGSGTLSTPKLLGTYTAGSQTAGVYEQVPGFTLHNLMGALDTTDPAQRELRNNLLCTLAFQVLEAGTHAEQVSSSNETTYTKKVPESVVYLVDKYGLILPDDKKATLQKNAEQVGAIWDEEVCMPSLDRNPKNLLFDISLLSASLETPEVDVAPSSINAYDNNAIAAVIVPALAKYGVHELTGKLLGAVVHIDFDTAGSRTSYHDELSRLLDHRVADLSYAELRFFSQKSPAPVHERRGDIVSFGRHLRHAAIFTELREETDQAPDPLESLDWSIFYAGVLTDKSSGRGSQHIPPRKVDSLPSAGERSVTIRARAQSLAEKLSSQEFSHTLDHVEPAVPGITGQALLRTQR